MERGFFNLPLVIWYPALAFILLSIAFISIPKRQRRNLFYESLIWGFLLSLIVSAIFTKIGILEYRHAGPFVFLGSPIWTDLGWAPTIMMYLYFQPSRNEPIKFWSYIFTFSVLSGLLDTVFYNLKLLRYIHWSPIIRICIAFPWFFGASLFHEKFYKSKTGIQNKTRG